MPKKPTIRKPREKKPSPGRLRDSVEASRYRDEIAFKQQGIDPVTKSKLFDKVLDHQHYGDQRCRGVLNRNTNTFEGKVYNNYCRFIRSSTTLSLPDILRNLADYLEKDYSSNMIHHSALTLDTKQFANLPAEDQRAILGKFNLEGKNVSERMKHARELIRDGRISTKMILEYKNKKR